MEALPPRLRARGLPDTLGAMPSWNKISPEQAARFDAALPVSPALERRSMFGCPIAVVNGNMFTGVHNDEINVRLAEADRNRFLREYEGARIFTPMKGMQMKEYVVIPPAVAENGALLARWLRNGFDFASTLPPKLPKVKKVPAAPRAKAAATPRTSKKKAAPRKAAPAKRAAAKRRTAKPVARKAAGKK